MAILLIDTYDRAIFESLSMFTEESLGDRTNFTAHTLPNAERLKQFVAIGWLPSERQPTDTFVVTDEHVIVTITWNDRRGAENWHGNKLASSPPGLISTELVEI
jgi:hypothetical protein